MNWPFARRSVRYKVVTFRRLTWLGVVSSLAIALASFGAGAIRNRGGVLEALHLSVLSYGHGAGLSNTLLWIGLFGYIATWALLGKTLRMREASLSQLQRLLAWWLLPLVFAAPILSRDVYSYLMQGAMLRDGFDPYTQGAAVNPGPMLLEVSHDWRNTTTPYGPLHLWIGEIITSLIGDNVTLGVLLYKVISIFGFVLIAWSIPLIARRLGASEQWSLWIGVMNPVMVFHLIGGMHNESLMVGLVSVGVLAALRRKFIIAVVCIAVSVSLKATAVIALPFVVWMAMRAQVDSWSASDIKRRLIAFVLSGAWMTMLTVAVVGAVTWASGASWGWISQISGNSKVINPLAAPSLIASLITPIGQVIDEDLDYNSFLAITRPVSQVLMLVGLVLVWWLFRHNNTRAVKGIVAAYAVAVVFNAVTLPWYYTSLVSLVGTYQASAKFHRLVTFLSMVVAASFAGSGNHMLYNTVWMTMVVVAAWLAANFVFSSDAKTPSTARAA